MAFLEKPPPEKDEDRDDELESKLAHAQSQLVLYARDLRRVVSRDRERSGELDLAHRQLRRYALDLKRALAAERQRARDLERSHLDTLMRLTRAAQYKDEETGAHLLRIRRYSELLARHVGIDEADASRIATAAPMHDLGKIGIPDAIMRKPGPLDDAEWDVMRRHSAIGASLLKGSASPLIETARVIALTHHERWDGSGYPQGLSGRQIPRAGRIVMLVDVYDALRSPRPYKSACSHEETVDMMLNGGERTRPDHFDPELLEIFRELHPRFAEIYDRFDS